MKNSFFILAALCVLTTVSSSCNKTYECVCKDSFGTESKHLVTGTQKKEAKINCDKHDINGNCELGAKQ